MTTWIRVSLAAAVVLAGCEHKKKTEPDQGGGTTQNGSGSAMGSMEGHDMGSMDGHSMGSGGSAGSAGSGSGDGDMAGSGSAGSAGSAAATVSNSHDNVVEPTAADLAEYTKDLPGKGDKLMAEITTSEGVLHCELFPKAAMTVANFIGLATGKKAWTDPRTNKTMKDTPFFDGIRCHRVVKGFMMQCGDPLGNGTGGPGYAMDQEVYPDLIHEAGTMSMANTGRPHSSGSQFFIMDSRSTQLDGGYSVFGKCKEVDVVKKITALQTPGTEAPNKTVTLDKVTISKGK